MSALLFATFLRSCGSTADHSGLVGSGTDVHVRLIAVPLSKEISPQRVSAVTAASRLTAKWVHPSVGKARAALRGVVAPVARHSTGPAGRGMHARSLRRPRARMWRSQSLSWAKQRADSVTPARLLVPAQRV